MSNLNAFEIRWSILQEAKNMLYEEWYKKNEIQERNHNKTSSTLEVMIPPPSAEEIKKLANELYEFVQQKSS